MISINIIYGVYHIILWEMKKKNVESNIQSLNSEKEELLLLIKELNNTSQTKWIEKNRKEYEKISGRLVNLNNTVDAEIRTLSLHDSQRKDLEALQRELLVMNWMLNQNPEFKHSQNVQPHQPEQTYNQAWIESDNISNKPQTQVIDIPDNTKGWEQWWDKTLRKFWIVAAWIWWWALMYNWIKSLFWKEEESEENDNIIQDNKDNDTWDEKDQKGKKDDSKQDDSADNKENWDNAWDEAEENEEYDESLVKRYKEMAEYLEKRWKISNHKQWECSDDLECVHGGDNNYRQIAISGLDFKYSNKNKEYEYGQLALQEDSTWKPEFQYNKWCVYKDGQWREGQRIKINNKKLKDLLDMYDSYIKKYG